LRFIHLTSFHEKLHIFIVDRDGTGGFRNVIRASGKARDSEKERYTSKLLWGDHDVGEVKVLRIDEPLSDKLEGTLGKRNSMCVCMC